MPGMALCFSPKRRRNAAAAAAENGASPESEPEPAAPPLKRWTKKKKAGTEVWFGRQPEDLPSMKLGLLDEDMFAAYTGPDRGLALVHDLELKLQATDNQQDRDANCNESPRPQLKSSGLRGHENIAGAKTWNTKNRKAYGICMSLYDQHPVNGRISGDPIADSFGICARKNNAMMIVADGVNWGEKSKMAARCAIYGCMKFVNERLFGPKLIRNSHEAFLLLLSSLEEAQQTILRHEGGLTTLCIALIAPLRDSKQFVVCIANVGDSLAYVFSKFHGIREITTGSHDIQAERNIRDAGGALGPVNGLDPELHNLTCSLTVCDQGDIVYLTTDGISDNFDPVVTKIAIAKRRHSDSELPQSKSSGELPLTPDSPPSPDKDGTNPLNGIPHEPVVECGIRDGKPEMQPHERHQYAVKEMERIIHEFELFTEQPCSAQELCGALLQHVLKLTDPKRKVLENPDLYGKKLRSKDRKRRDSEIMAKLTRSPGKLDHASIAGYEVGIYHGNDDEDYEDEEKEEEENSDEGDSASQAGPSQLHYVLPDRQTIPYGIDLDDIDFIDENDDDAKSRTVPATL